MSGSRTRAAYSSLRADLRVAVRAALLALLLAGAPAAQSREVAGVEFPEAAQWESQSLLLNGAGLRRKFFVRVYACALYVGHRAREAQAIIDADQPWMVSMVFLRDVDHEKILDGFRDAFERNSPGQFERLKPGLVKFHDEVMSDLIVRKGQRLSIGYLPGQGSTLVVPGGHSSRVPGKEFGDALLRAYVGSRPTDRHLADLLLGRADDP